MTGNPSLGKAMNGFSTTEVSTFEEIALLHPDSFIKTISVKRIYP